MTRIGAPYRSQLAAGGITAASLAALMSTGYGSVAVSHADSWSQQAESVCSEIYGSMGGPASVGNASDKMALFQQWHSALLTRTADALSRIPGSTPESRTYVSGIVYLSKLERSDASIQAKGGDDPVLDVKLLRVQQDLGSRAAALNVPTCDKIVNY